MVGGQPNGHTRMSQSDFQRYQNEFCAHARNPRLHPRPAGVSAKRIGIYAELLFNNMEGTLSGCFPVCKKVLGVRKWNKLVRVFFAEHRCTTPLFRQIPEEFLQWLQQADPVGLPPFIPQLAHYEWAELAVAVADATMPAAWNADGDLVEGKPVLTPALMLLRYDWPVQRISPRFKPIQPLTEPVSLLVFRDAMDEVRFIELNPVSAHLVELLQEGSRTGREALISIAQALRHPDAEQVVTFGAQILADLKARGAILGASPCK
jgi:hypothetical protein